MNISQRIKAQAFASFVVLLGAAFAAGQANGAGTSATDSAPHAMSVRYEDLKWQAIVPEMGNDSPQMAMLRVDPKTNAAQLLIRTPKMMHVPSHWHTANETHTIVMGTAVLEHEGQRETLGPGGFNYMPAKMQHQAWTSAGAVLLITVDGCLGRKLGQESAGCG